MGEHNIPKNKAVERVVLEAENEVLKSTVAALTHQNKHLQSIVDGATLENIQDTVTPDHIRIWAKTCGSRRLESQFMSAAEALEKATAYWEQLEAVEKWGQELDDNQQNQIAQLERIESMLKHLMEVQNET